MSILFGNKIDTYRRRANIILQVSTGPGGWCYATWSYCEKVRRYELAVFCNEHGRTRLGSLVVDSDHGVGSARCIDKLLQAPRSIQWHFSGQAVAVAEGGRMYLFSVQWLSHRDGTATPVSLSQASRIYCSHLEEEGQQEKEGAEAAQGNTAITVDLALRKRSIHIGASAVTVANSGLRGLERVLEDGSGEREGSLLCPGVLLVGTGLGAVLALRWSWQDGPAEPAHAEDRGEPAGLERQDTEDGDGAPAVVALPVRMAAVVLTAAEGAYGEDRALLRPWQGNDFAAAEARPLSPSPSGATVMGVEVLDVGDSLADAAQHDASGTSPGLECAMDDMFSGAGAVKSVSFEDRDGVLVVLYSDGSFRASVLTADGDKETKIASPGLVRVQQSPRIHPVLLVAYPLDGAQQVGEKLPGVYEMGPSGAYRSSDFVTAQDVQQLLDLPPALLAKVSRMRKLVTGRAEEEIGRCIGLRVVSGSDGALQVLCMVHTRHLPALTYASCGIPAGSSGDTEAADGDDSVLGPRSESVTLMLLSMRCGTPNPSNAAPMSTVDCLQVACVEKLTPQSEGSGERRRWNGAASAGAAGCASSLLELIHLPGTNAAYAMVLHSCGLLTIRPVENLQSAVLSLQCAGAPLSGSLHSAPRTVCCCVGAGTLVLSVWSSAAAAADEDASQPPAVGPVGGSLVTHIPLLTSLSQGRAADQSGDAFLDLSASAFVRLSCADGEAVAKENAGKRAARAEGSDLSDAHHLSPELWTLQLPRRLLGEVWRYRSASAASGLLQQRRFQPPFQGGLLYARSKPSAPARDSAAQYLAFVAGGPAAQHTAQVSPSTSADPDPREARLLWIYNCRTCRWRAVSLAAGSEGSSAHVLRNVPWVASPRAREEDGNAPTAAPPSTVAGTPERKGLRRRSENDVLLSAPSVALLSGRQPAEKRAPALSIASIAAALASQVSSAKSLADRDEKGTLVRISARSQLAGSPSAVLRVAWCGSDTLVLLTLRRSTFCLEVVSREASKASLSAGKPQPAVHRVVMLPPGYSPSDLYVVPLSAAASAAANGSGAVPAGPRSSPRKDRRPSGSFFSRASSVPDDHIHDGDWSAESHRAYAAVVSDGSHVFCYHISVCLSAVPQASQVDAARTPAITGPRLCDYRVCVLWEVGLAGLACSADFLTSLPEDNSSAESGIKFPIKEIVPFVQRRPMQDEQEEGFGRLSRAAATDPLFAVAVNMLILDSSGCVWSVDADLRGCALVSRGPVSSITAQDVQLAEEAPYNGVAASSGVVDVPALSGRQPSLERAFLLSYTQERSSQAQSRLLYIFRKTSLIQHLRTTAAGAVERASFQRSVLWFPTSWQIGDAHQAPADLFHVPSSDDQLTHPFSDADVAAAAHGRGAEPRCRPIHTVAALSLPPLPPGQHLMGISAGGVCQCLSRSHIDLSSGDPCNAVAALPTACLVSTMSAAFAAIFESDHSPLRLDAVGLSEDAVADAAERLSRHLALGVFRSLRATPRATALLTSQLESLVRSWCEQPGFSHEHVAYRRLTCFLAAADPSFLCELLSRLGRKLEPAVGRLLFPVQISAEVYPEKVNVVALFQRSLRLRQLHHAARLLSLACEAVGGSESHISTAASLFIALELLAASARNCSLRCVTECFEFCVRLEDMLALHAKAIFGDAPDPDTAGHHSLDSSYVKTVKSRAVALIESHSSWGAAPGDPVRARADSEPMFNSLTAASPALPYYLGVGVGWVLDKAAQSLFPAPRPPGHGQISPSPRGAARGPDNARVPRLSIRTSSSHGFFSGVEEPPGGLCGVINMIEAHSGAGLLSEMLSRTTDALGHDSAGAPLETSTAGGHPPHHPEVPGPTILSLVLVLKAMFQNSSHFCNAAVLMMALTQLPAARAMVRRFIDWDSNASPARLSRTTAASARDKVRRILYVFHLNKAISKDHGATSTILSHRICAQYMRRVVEADGMQFVPSTPSLMRGPLAESPRSAKDNAPPVPDQTDYFELTEDLLRRSPAGQAANPDATQARARSCSINSSGAADFLLLDLVKALALSLLFTRDFATAGLLLLALEPHLSAVAPALHTALHGLPAPRTVAAADEPGGAEVDGASDGAALARESKEYEQMLWDVTDKQLAAVAAALCGDA